MNGQCIQIAQLHKLWQYLNVFTNLALLIFRVNLDIVGHFLQFVFWDLFLYLFYTLDQQNINVSNP